ncbi:MAG: hypothetical protein JST49_07015 [Bacteroidetes bacterium]|nr:hypothetical protein [Bacteroidota bacterium]
MRASVAFTLLITAVAASLWLPNLFTYGMFMDGVINASVAKLYAEGTGSYFHLQERYYENGAYVGHPPLAFVMQGSFFKIFGTTYYMDKLYSMLCALAQLVLIVLGWRVLVTDKKLKAYAWLPCLLWLVSPIISWGYSSNLLENSMSLFTTAALIAVLAYVRNGKQMLAMAVLSGMFVFAAVLCKGPVGLFVLAAPMLFVEVRGGFTLKKAVAFSTIMAVTLALLLSGLLLLPDARQLASAYLNTQISPSISTEGASLLNRLQLIPNLLKALLPLLIIAAVVLIGKRWLPFKDDRQERTLGIRLLLLGLCATLPIMLSNKQSAFYVVPAIPVFALGFALLTASPVRILCERLVIAKVRIGIGVLSTLCIAAMVLLSVWNTGNIIRDVDMLRDLERVSEIMAEDKSLLDQHNEFIAEYHLKAYLNRLHGKAVYSQGQGTWIITKKDSPYLGVGQNFYEGKSVRLLYNKQE